MKTKIILLLVLSNCIGIFLQADTPYNFNERVEPTRVFNIIQNEFSKRLNHTFSKLTEKERQALYNEASNILYGPYLNAYQTFSKEQIHTAVDQVLTERAGRYMENLARNYTSELVLTPEQVREKYKQKIKQECQARPEENIFDMYLNEKVIYEHLNNFNTKTVTSTYPTTYTSEYTTFAQNLYHILEWLFPERHTTTPIDIPSTTSSTSTTYEDRNDNFSITVSTSHTPAHIHPTGECFCGDAEGFSKTNESFFLSCGHNVCKNIINDWIMTKSTCPFCRTVISSEEKTFLKRALTTVAVCALCYQKDIPLHSLSWCDHYLCGPCKNVWINKKDGYPSRCPRCFTFR